MGAAHLSGLDFADPAKRAAWIYGQPMRDCPSCGAYDIRYQLPIQMEPLSADDTARQALGKWARATRGGATPLQGPFYMMCGTCLHRGPALDCSGRTSEDVRRDPVAAAEVKRLWNEQPDMVTE